MKHFIFGLIATCCLDISYGQPTVSLSQSAPYYAYYGAINQADSCRLAGNSALADSIYARAFTLVNRPFKQDCLTAFENSINLDKTKALNYLGMACALGLTKKQLTQNQAFDSLTKKEKSALFKHIHQTEIETNDSLVGVIDKMVKKDQKARVFWTDWLKWEKQVKIMDKIDRPNAIQLLDICQKMGWPGFSAIGENTFTKYRVEDAALLILHFSKEEYLNLLPYMITAVEQGEMYPYQLARCTDYLFMGTESDSADYRVLEIKQLFGTMYSGTEIIPFGSVDEVNARRKALGMEPIQQYAAERHLTLPTLKKQRYTSKK